ncbi:hypothetical protein [Herpetosiphon geysericola]|uniref:Uncharacterized protein n=1 Tax=Herpetosiphon geysericola TaxID=70996 RepID=A0A0P6Z189_9CHLR|nr:hypothetical protein [Herpetosiphon geysericola]KPL90755.1 hypothetical protein SE18_05155 [Herpetosiphon geysericola]
MPANLFLRLRTADGLKSFTFTDNVASSMLGEGWQPGDVSATANGYTLADVAIPARIKGATAAQCAANLNILNDILQQAARFAAGEDVSMVLLDVTMKGSNPAKLLTCAVKGWNPAGFLPANYYDHIVTTGKVDVVVNLTHTVLFHTGWVYENLASGTAWASAPTVVASGVTVAHVPATMPYGGNGYIELTKSSGADANFRITSMPISLTIGQPVTISMDISADASITDVRVLLWNGSTYSNIQPLAVSTTPIGGGVRTRVTLLPTSTVTAYLYFQIFGGNAAAKLRIGEILVVSGSGIDDGWHRTYSEQTNGTPFATGGSPDLSYALWPVSHAHLSPVKITLARGGGQVDYRHPSCFLIFSDRQPSGFYELEYDYWQTAVSAPFSLNGEIEAFGGNTLRYTPAGTGVARTPWQNMPYGSTGWKGMLNAFLGCRNNSGSTSFTVWIEFADSTTLQIAESDKKIIAAGASTPTWYLIGRAAIAKRRAAAKYRIAVQATAASGTFDINPSAFIHMQPGATIVQLDSIDLGSSTYNFNSIVLDHQLLSDRAPAVAAVNAAPAIDSPISYWTSPIVNMAGNQLWGLMLGMNGNKWRTYLTGAVTIEQWDLFGQRLPAYPVPE